MQVFKLLCAAIALGSVRSPRPRLNLRPGAQGPEGTPDRSQPWLVASPDRSGVARAVLFRPPGDGPFPLAIIAHASTQNVLRRAQMPQPEYRALASWLVRRGYAVLVPERPGHGLTGGQYLEDQGGCDEADYVHAGHATADSIAAALTYMRSQVFVRPNGTVIVGHSAGGWGALALAGQNPPGVAGGDRLCAGTRRPFQRPPQPGLRPAQPGEHGDRIRQGRARAGDLAGGAQRQLFFNRAVAAARRRIPRRRRQGGFS